MAVIKESILESALKDGLFAKPLTKNQKLYLMPSILTVWRFIAAIEKAGDNGLDREQLAHKLDLNSNTVKIYCEWMVGAGLIEKGIDRAGLNGRPSVIYFSIAER